jgi:hypothetical protein
MTWKFLSATDGFALDEGGRAACLGVAIQWHLAAKGSFQAVKLQRPARTTVCSHSNNGHAATRPIKSKHDPNDAQHKCLSPCGQP